MRTLDDRTAAANAQLQGAAPTEADLARMVALVGPQLAVVVRTELPFDSEPSHLVRGLARGKRA
jgi:hypothetical protein